MGSLFILSGPSCVGKSPLIEALKQFHPDSLAGRDQVVLYNDRAPRPSERDGVDYHFRRREEIEALRGDRRYRVLEVRGDLQALDLDELGARLESGHLLFEGNPMVGRVLLECPLPEDSTRRSAFIAPLSREEIVDLQRPELHMDLAGFVADVMRRKLLRRMQQQKTRLSLPDLEEAERRCRSAWDELGEAWRFDCVIPNHDGEDSDNWTAFGYPVGDARSTMLAVAALLAGRRPERAETWPRELLGGGGH